MWVKYEKYDAVQITKSSLDWALTNLHVFTVYTTVVYLYY